MRSRCRASSRTAPSNATFASSRSSIRRCRSTPGLAANHDDLQVDLSRDIGDALKRTLQSLQLGAQERQRVIGELLVVLLGVRPVAHERVIARPIVGIVHPTMGSSLSGALLICSVKTSVSRTPVIPVSGNRTVTRYS